ncbi:MAG: bacillithiol biosynthesis cysteine-adding enzyme BshC [Bacteroidetes bacterium]|nr:bacillithiol biosynthesis cysteine-adding enzyme BshC [Bacteroidota bacterium]
MTLRESIDITQTGFLPPLVKDYLSRDEKVKQLHSYYPELDNFKHAIADKQTNTINREALVAALRKQYEKLHASDFVNEHIAALLSPNTFTITAAHQPVLFTGPLFNIYKISSAINLAKQLKEGYPDFSFVPVFWMGSEDHDMDELNNTTVAGKRYEWSAGASGAVGRLNTSILQQALEEVRTAIGENEAIKIIEEAAAKCDTIAQFTQYVINEVFKPHGLVVINQDDATLKALFKNVIADEVFNNRATQKLSENIAYIEQHYKVQAKPRDINFFYLGEQYRERVIWDEAKACYVVNNQPISFTKEELQLEIDSAPERFSPNVFFRPLYQEMVLPNIAFVGGAGELSYWLELKPLFEHYKVSFPVLVMRSMAAIVAPSAISKLQKLDMQLPQFFKDVDLLVNEYIKDQAGSATSLAEQRAQVEAMYEVIGKKAEAVDITLVQSVAAEKQKALTVLDNLEGKMLKAEKRKQETSVNQIRAVHGSLFPNGSLQERVENFIPFYTPAFIEQCVETLNPLKQQFYIFIND